MIDEKALFKFKFVMMLSISVAEISVTLVSLFIVNKKECEKTQFMKSVVGGCVSCSANQRCNHQIVYIGSESNMAESDIR